MQTCSVEVSLNGDLLNTVIKNDVSVPEIILLRAIHGDDSVRFRGNVKESNVLHGKLAEHLRHNYKAAVQTSDGQGQVNVFTFKFGSFDPNYNKFPTRLAQSGLIGYNDEPSQEVVEPEPELQDTNDYDDADEEAPVVTKKKAGRPRKAQLQD